MPPPVKRSYRSEVRRQQAESTRRAILCAARALFTRDGYEATTLSAVAGRADVSVDTIYASVGRKPQLLLAVIDTILGSSDDPPPAGERDYVRAIRAATGARAKIETYAAALARLLPPLAPLQEGLREAADSDAECAEFHQRLTARRAANMLEFAADLRATGELRADLTDREIADIVWSTNAPEYFTLLTSRGWTPRRYQQLLIDMWTRLFLA